MSILTTLAGLLLAADAKLNAASANVASKVQVRSERKAAKLRMGAHTKANKTLGAVDTRLASDLALIRRRADQAEQQATIEAAARSEQARSQLDVDLDVAKKHDAVRDVCEAHVCSRTHRAATLSSIAGELKGV